MVFSCNFSQAHINRLTAVRVTLYQQTRRQHVKDHMATRIMF